MSCKNINKLIYLADIGRQIDRLVTPTREKLQKAQNRIDEGLNNFFTFWEKSQKLYEGLGL